MATGENADSQQYARISDIIKEPLVMHVPIEGYEEMPIVPLREAVVPLLSIIPKIQHYADIAKKRCESVPPDDLTQDESASIMLYSMEWEPHEECLSFALNATLRTEDRQKLKPWFSYLKLLLTALEKLPSTPSNVVRGMNLDLANQYSVRKTFVWWGFSSCTTSIEVLEKEQILGKTGQRTVFTIECDSGKDISRHSYYKSKKEVLLLPARQFMVVGCFEQAQGLHIIQLKETMPPFTLLQPVTNQSVQIQSTSGQIQMRINHYNQYAITVAGGKGDGQQLNQLNSPEGIFIDTKRLIYIADSGNHRIIKRNLSLNTDKIIAGGDENNQLTFPTNIVFDKKTNSFIISDKENKRVIRYFDKNQTNQQIMISNIYCSRLTIDKNGFIYASDLENNEVRRWKQGDTKGELVAGGNGKGNKLNQLNDPTFIFVDEDQSVYVSDTGNHRVIVDDLDQIYVADCNNHRVMRWCEGDKEGEIVVGRNGRRNQPYHLNQPTRLSFDDEENLYVVDKNNHRIQKYEKLSN
ncbi:unnamed protein product [Adineta steineri]|uniref:NAD(P)(+)--arginine ADP-ribosyltransferase n=1 Tax=Adineta steineri TaxID=433720 RepID=A0A814T527_9BILA|nr:unnamed protein product [Adineta steineri]CAF1586900.1 unnamed protein product [Adineta steineri]